MCPGYFGGDFLTFWLWVREGSQALFCKFLIFSTLTITGINSHSNSYKIKDSPPNPHHLGRLCYLGGSKKSKIEQLIWFPVACCQTIETDSHFQCRGMGKLPVLPVFVSEKPERCCSQSQRFSFAAKREERERSGKREERERSGKREERERSGKREERERSGKRKVVAID